MKIPISGYVCQPDQESEPGVGRNRYSSSLPCPPPLTGFAFWVGVPRSDALIALSDCRVMIHPSLYDSGGWACLAAIAAGIVRLLSPDESFYDLEEMKRFVEENSAVRSAETIFQNV